MWLLYDPSDDKLKKKVMVIISAIPYSTILYLSAPRYLDEFWLACVRIPKLARL
jgi:hypothetical protein